MKSASLTASTFSASSSERSITQMVQPDGSCSLAKSPSGSDGLVRHNTFGIDHSSLLRKWEVYPRRRISLQQAAL